MNIRVIVLACIMASLAAVSLGAEHNVKSEAGTRVTLNGQMEHAALEAVDPESLQRSGDFPVIVTKTFKPPASSNKTFAKFPGSNTHVDVLDNQDGFMPLKSLDTPTAVKVSRMFLATTAAQFPLQVEGNLEGGGGGGTTEYWAVKVPKNKKMIALQGVSQYAMSGDLISARAYALSDLTPQEGITVTFKIEDDKGALEGGDPFDSDTTTDQIGGTDYVAGLMKAAPAAHDDAVTYKLTASAPDYEPAVAYIQIYKARWLENPAHEFEGYDPIPDPDDAKKRPQLVVGKEKTSQASKLKLEQAVENVQIAVTANATIQPGQTSDAETATSFTGVNKGAADATASKGETTYAEMKVSVKNALAGHTLKFIFVKDTPGQGQEQHSGELTAEAREAVFVGAQKLWSDQAVYGITEKTGDPEVWTLAQYLADSVTVEDANTVVATHARPPEGEVYVYVFWSLQLPFGTGGGFVNSARPREIIADKTITLEILAHELGHVLGVPGDYPATGDHNDDLMAYGYRNRRIHKYQADMVNP
jgi:hypothetical protein